MIVNSISIMASVTAEVSNPGSRQTPAFHRLFWLLFGISIAAQFYNVFRGIWDHDEVEHLHAAWLVAQGKIPFVDFFEHHQPILWYLLAPLTGIFEPAQAVIAGRLIMLLFVAGTLILVLDMARRLTGRLDLALLSVMLLQGSYGFAGVSLEIRPDVAQTFFMCLALDFFIIWTTSHAFGHALLWGSALGCAIAILHKAIVWLPAFALGALILLIRERAHRWRTFGQAFVAFSGCALWVLGEYAALAWKGALDDYLELGFGFNLAIHIKSQLGLHLPRMEALLLTIGKSTFLFILGLLGLFPLL